MEDIDQRDQRDQYRRVATESENHSLLARAAAACAEAFSENPVSLPKGVVEAIGVDNREEAAKVLKESAQYMGEVAASEARMSADAEVVAASIDVTE